MICNVPGLRDNSLSWQFRREPLWIFENKFGQHFQMHIYMFVELNFLDFFLENADPYIDFCKGLRNKYRFWQAPWCCNIFYLLTSVLIGPSHPEGSDSFHDILLASLSFCFKEFFILRSCHNLSSKILAIWEVFNFSTAFFLSIRPRNGTHGQGCFSGVLHRQKGLWGISPCDETGLKIVKVEGELLMKIRSFFQRRCPSWCWLVLFPPHRCDLFFQYSFEAAVVRKIV